MGFFAKLENNLVVNVIVAEQSFIDTLEDKDSWIETFDSNHTSPKNLASIGALYDEERDAFISEKPDDNWVLNEDTCLWEEITNDN